MSPLAARIILPNEQVQYVVEVAGSPDTSLTWTATAGTVVNGLYAAPPAAAYSTQTITLSRTLRRCQNSKALTADDTA